MKNNKKYTPGDYMFATKMAKKTIAVNLLGGKCESCGEDNVFVLEFHHLGEKDRNISSMLTCDIERIKKEISKCKLLCGNCHASLHSKGGSTAKNKIRQLGIRKSKKCELCDNTNISCLCFHHRNKDNKKYATNSMRISINPLYKGKISKKDILKELNKCSVLCRNCHLMHHFDKIKYEKTKSLIDYKLLMYQQIESDKIKDAEIKIKNSNFRKTLSQYLRLWKTIRCVKRTAILLNLNYFQLRSDLLYSETFVTLITRKKETVSRTEDASIILLTQGQEAIVDKEDYEWLSKYNWCAHRVSSYKGEYYFSPVRNTKVNGKTKTIAMSGSILEKHGIKNDGMQIMCLNKNRLDNRKCNLRVATKSEISRSGSKLNTEDTKYKRVRWEADRSVWLSSIKVGDKYVCLGRFDKEEFAAYVSDRAYIKLLHSCEYTNFLYTPEEMSEEIKDKIPFYLFPKKKVLL